VNSFPISIKSFGEQAILIEWPNRVEETILYDILRFNRYLIENYLDSKEWESVPAYNSLTLINRKRTIDFKVLKRDLRERYSKNQDLVSTQRFIWKLPVCYDLEFGIDLEEVSLLLGKTITETVAFHTQHTYTVYGIGFLPGFMYLGGLPKTMETPRKSVPRLKVLKGSVGLAGKQTGIYPQESPGGWNIIGSCPIPIFNVSNNNPFFINVGDKIQFYAISKAEYDLHKIETEVGIYKIKKTKINA